MKYLMTEEEALYMDVYHGHFSRKLASWAIGNMEMEDPATGKMKPVTVRPVDDVLGILRDNKVDIPDECTFDAWYLYHMTLADYQKTLKTDELRSSYVCETINDPDGEPTNVLACFVAKMCNAGKPIFWEMFM